MMLLLYKTFNEYTLSLGTVQQPELLKEKLSENEMKKKISENEKLMKQMSLTWEEKLHKTGWYNDNI